MGEMRSDRSATESMSGDAVVLASSAVRSLDFRCVLCGSSHSFEEDLCGACGGIVDPIYNLSSVAFGESDDPMEKYFDLLPIRSREALLPGVATKTPCLPSSEIAKYVGVDEVWLKDETKQPTGSTKDRMAAIVVAAYRERGIRSFVASSTGNSSTALARAVSIEDNMEADFFCGERFAPNHTFPNDARVRLHVIDDDFVAAGRAARSFATANGVTLEGGFSSWARREGLKTAYLEAFDQMPVPPDVVVQSVSSGMGVVGAYKGATEYQQLGLLKRKPQIIMTQQDSCAPMAAGWASGKRELGDGDVVANPTGKATAILRGDGRQSYPYLRSIALQTAGGIYDASEPDMEDARTLLRVSHGIDACYASAAAIAGVRNSVRHGVVKTGSRVLIMITGSIRAV